MKSKISIITLGVKDFEKSFSFYKNLGFKTHNYKQGDTCVFFKMDGTWLSIVPIEELAKDITISNDGKGFSGITLAHNVKSKMEVDKVYKDAIKAGAAPIKEPQEVF